MKYVLDASCAVKLQLQEQDSDKVNRIIQNVRAGRDELLEPDFFFTECGHVFFKAERNKKIAAGDARKMIQALIAENPMIYESTPLLPRAAAICQHVRKSLYDCVYMALAEREYAQMITADMKLWKAAQADYPYVLDIASFP